MIKFRYKRKPSSEKMDTNVPVSTCKSATQSPSEGLPHIPARPLSPDQVIITAEQQETFLSCVRAVVVSFLSPVSHALKSPNESPKLISVDVLINRFPLPSLGTVFPAANQFRARPMSGASAQSVGQWSAVRTSLPLGLPGRCGRVL